MRIHTNILLILMIILSIILKLILKLNPYKLFLISEITTIIFSLIFNKFLRILYDFREILGKDINIEKTKIIFISLVILSNIILAINFKKLKNKKL